MRRYVNIGNVVDNLCYLGLTGLDGPMMVSIPIVPLTVLYQLYQQQQAQC